MTASTPLLALQDCLKAAGNQTKLADALGTTQATVSRWLKAGRISEKYVLKAEGLFGVSRHALRPDYYPIETATSDAAQVAA